MGQSHPRELVNTRGPSDLIASHPVQLVKHAGLRTRARVIRKSWSTPRALGTDNESPWRAGRHQGPSDPGGVQPGQLVNPAGPRAWARARVDWDSWMSLPALGHGPESPRAAGRHGGHSATGPCHLGQLVDPAGPGTCARVPRDCWSTPRDLRPRPESRGQAGRSRRSSHTTWRRVARDSWMTLRALGHRTESPWTGGRTHGASDQVPCRQGQLVEHAVLQTIAQVARDSWSTTGDLA